MARNKRSRFERDRDRQIITELYLKGWSQAKIGEYLEIHQTLVSYEIRKIKAAWKTKAAEEFEVYIAQELERLSLVERELWSAWEKSQEPKEQTLQERMEDAVAGSDSRIKAQRKIENRVGDPRFLEGLLKLLDQRAKLLGLYPSKESPTAMSNPDDVLKLYLSQAKPSANPGFNPLELLP